MSVHGYDIDSGPIDIDIYCHPHRLRIASSTHEELAGRRVLKWREDRMYPYIAAKRGSELYEAFLISTKVLVRKAREEYG